MSGYRSKLSGNEYDKNPVIEDVDTLMRYRKKGIPLTPKQIRFLQDQGVQVLDYHAEMMEIVP